VANDLGTLTLSLIAETAKFTSGFKDAAATVTSSTNSMKASLAGVSAAVEATKTVIGSLGVALSVGGIVEWSRGVVEAADNLEKLSAITGSSVEDLSRLSNIAKVTGTDFATFQTLLDRMTVAMSGLGDGTTKGAKALEFLGVSAKDPATALQEVADKLNEYADGTGKAAIAQDLFGKGGVALLPVLKDLATQHAVSATVTAQDAAAAKALSDQLGVLSVNSTAFKDALLRDVVPGLTSLIQQFNDARASGQGFWAALDTVTTDDKFGQRIADTKKQIDDLKASLARVIPGTPEALYSQASQARLEQLQKDLTLVTQAQAKWASAWASGLGFTGDARDLALANMNAKPQANYTVGGNAGAAGPVGDSAAASFINSLSDQVNELGLAGTALTLYKANMMGVTAEIAPAVAELQQYNDALAALKETQAQSIAEHEGTAEAARADATATIDQQNAIQTLIASIKDKTETLGLDSIAVEEHAALMANDAAFTDKSSQAYLDNAAAIKQAFDQRRLAQGAIDSAKQIDQAFADTSRDIERSLTDAIYNGLFKSGETWGDALKQYLEQTFKKLVLQPILAPISAGIAGLFTSGAAGASPLGGAGSALGGLSSLSSLSSLASGASNFLSAGTSLMSGAAATFVNSGIGASLGLSSPGIAGGLSLGVEAGATAADAAVAGGATIAGEGLIAAIPVVGWALAAAAIAYEIFGNKGGAPKQGGFGSAGNIGGLPVDSDNHRYYSPNDADSQLGQLASGEQSTYAAQLGALGGTGTAGFAFGYDTDPGGSADSRLSAGATVNGQSVYSVRNRDEGKGTDQINADLQTEAQRALLAALQASDLPQDIAHLLDSVTAATASSTDITNIIAQATALKSVTDILAKNPMSDALDAIAASSQTATGALDSQVTAAESLVKAFDGTAASSQALAASAQSIYSAEIAVIAQAQQVKTSLGSLFSDTIRGFQLSTLDNQGKYNFYQQDEASVTSQLQTATDPAVIQSLTQQAVADASAAFGLLSPAQQKQQLAAFTQALNQIQTLETQRLNAVQTAATNEANTVLGDIKTVLSTIAVQNQKAADTQVTAANTNLAAANRPLTINLNVTGAGAEVTTSG
jgi:hypothetical protein